MGDSFRVSTQYGDLKETAAIDGHETGGPLDELAKETTLKRGFVPVGFGLHQLHTNDDGKLPFAAWLRRAGRPDEKVWPGNWCQRAAQMLQVDLATAEITYETDDGLLDFHALRVMFISSLVRGGIHPKIVRTLARHSQIELTMQLYTQPI